MKVEIIKDHESGLKAGQVKNLSIIDARNLVDSGIAVYSDGEKITKKATKKKSE